MSSNYKRIGDYIEQLKIKNKEGKYSELLGINIDKFFMPSVANTVGVNLNNYKIVKKGQFACNRMHVGRDYRIPIALSDKEIPFLVSPAYDVFQIKKENELLPEYLMMWFRRKEYDRNAWFHTDADVRGGLAWEVFCDLKLPIPSIEKQLEIVKEYHTVTNRIKLNEQINQKLEETAQALYKHWFLEFETEETQCLDELIDFNPKHSISKGAFVSYIEMSNVQENTMSIKNPIQREYTSGSKFKNYDTLLARITPCLENGKTAFVNCLSENEVAYGSTEFIVMRAKNGISPYFVYCLAKDESFRSYAISSMVGSSGRQRVHCNYLKELNIKKIVIDRMQSFEIQVKPIFELIKQKATENKNLENVKDLLLSKMTKVEVEEQMIK